MLTHKTTSARAALKAFRWLMLVVCIAVPALSYAATPVVFYSDLDSGPNTGGENNKGVYVTVWGKNFGSTRGTGSVRIGGGQADNYPIWSDTKITFQLGANASSGSIAVTNGNGETSNGVPFTVRAGRIFFVSPSGSGNGSATSPMSPADAWSGIQPGDTYYFRSGTYTSRNSFYGTWNFGLGASRTGTAGNPLAFVGYPNETAILQTSSGGAFGMRDADTASAHANYVTIANLTMQSGDECIASGAVTVAYGEVAKSGVRALRVVGNVCSASYSGNTMTGLMQIGGDNSRILGNEFKDTGTSPPINNNHGIYVQVGVTDAEVAWNYFHNLRMGHVIQVHTDTYFQYTDIRIHDNVITATNPNDCRGINVGNVLSGTYGSIYNNILYNIGQDFSGIAIYGGAWKVYNNTLYNVKSSDGLIWVSNMSQTKDGSAQIFNNILYSDGASAYVGVSSGASMNQITLSNNLYYNHGTPPSQDANAVTGDPLFINSAVGNFRLQTGSPALDRGTDRTEVRTTVLADHDGVPRPQNAGYDIGAYESIGDSLPRPQNLTIRRQ